MDEPVRDGRWLPGRETGHAFGKDLAIRGTQ